MKSAMAPLPEILALLELITAALRSDDQEGSRVLLQKVLDEMKKRPMDLCDRMTVRIVLGRIQRAGGRSMAQAMESCLCAG